MSDFSLDENIFSPVYQTSQAILRAVNFTIDNPSYMSEKPDRHPVNRLDSDNFNFLGSPEKQGMRRTLSGEIDGERDKLEIKPISLRVEDPKKKQEFCCQFPEVQVSRLQCSTQTEASPVPKTKDAASQRDFVVETIKTCSTESQTLRVSVNSVSTEVEPTAVKINIFKISTLDIKGCKPSKVSVALETAPQAVASIEAESQPQKTPELLACKKDASYQTEADTIIKPEVHHVYVETETMPAIASLPQSSTIQPALLQPKLPLTTEFSSQTVILETSSKGIQAANPLPVTSVFSSQCPQTPVKYVDASVECQIEVAGKPKSAAGVPNLLAGVSHQVKKTYADDLSGSKADSDKEKIEKMQSMIVNYELSMKSKDSMISAYKEKLEEVNAKLEAVENTKKKQKELMKKKDDENAYYLETIMSVKKEYMELQEKHTNLQMAFTKSQQKAVKDKADKEKESNSSIFQSIAKQLL